MSTFIITSPDWREGRKVRVMLNPDDILDNEAKRLLFPNAKPVLKKGGV